MIHRILTLVFGLLSLTIVAKVHARAPDTFEEEYQPPILIESPNWFNFELKVGPYHPGHGSKTFKEVFGDDRGWMMNLEFDATVFHIPYAGQVGVAGLWGWAGYDAKALTSEGTRAGEETKFTLYPLSAMGFLRIDALARYTMIPVTFAGKLGYEWVRWKAETGSAKEGSGFNKGLRWAVQAALELDFLERASARRLDEDFGINHTYLMFEYYDSDTDATGDRTFQFGLGLAF